jgi:dienelactone hydrolase
MPENYQILAFNTDEQLLSIFHKLQGTYNLHKKLFLYGHSGGAQFAHRFALAHPRDVAGCCATSAGSWADDPSSSASSVPIAVSCGENDKAFSAPGDPMTRIVWAHKFAKDLERGHFFYKAKFWPGAGHGGDGHGNAVLTDEAFSLGTRGMIGKESDDFSDKLREFKQAVESHNANQAKSAYDSLISLLNTVPSADDTQQNLTANGWTAYPGAVSACMQNRQDFVEEETKWLSDTLPSAGTPSANTASSGAPNSGTPSSPGTATPSPSAPSSGAPSGPSDLDAP